MPDVKPLSAEEIADARKMLDWSGVAWAQLLTELRKDADGTVHARGPDELRRFTLAAREILPRLLDEVERTRALLRRIEWSGNIGQGGLGCAVCEAEERQGHAPGCELAALLGGEG